MNKKAIRITLPFVLIVLGVTINMTHRMISAISDQQAEVVSANITVKPDSAVTDDRIGTVIVGAGAQFAPVASTTNTVVPEEEIRRLHGK